MAATVPTFNVLPNTQTQTESSYDAAWNDFFSTLPAWGAAVSTISTQVEANAANAEAAVGALADLEWAAGTFVKGNVRWSPTDGLDYRLISADGAYNTDPALDPVNWVPRIQVDPGGSDTSSSAVDITLTSTSGRLQVISMTVADKKVTLPSATTLRKGASIYVFNNAGAYKFHIYNGNNEYLASVNPGQTAAFHCSDISTAAGIWAANGQDLELVKPNTASVLNAVASTHIAVDMISATSAVVVFKNATSFKIDGVIINTDAANGSVTELTAEGAGGSTCGISVLSSTQMLLAYKGSTNKPRCIVIDYSGNTLTPDVAVDINTTTTGNSIDVKRTSDTSAVVSIVQGATLTLYAAAVTLSGSTPAPGTSVVIVTGAVIDPGTVIVISATKGMGLVNHANGIRSRLFSISGSAIAVMGSEFSFSTVNPGAGQIGACLLDSNRVLFAAAGTNNVYNFSVFLADVSGTDPEVVDQWDSPAKYNTYHCSLSKTDGTSALLLAASTGTSGGHCMKIRVSSNNRIRVEPITKMYTLVNPANYLQNLVQLSSGSAVLAYKGLDTFLNVQEVEVGL